MCDKAFRQVLGEEKSVQNHDHRLDRDRIGSARRAVRSLAVAKTETH